MSFLNLLINSETTMLTLHCSCKSNGLDKTAGILTQIMAVAWNWASIVFFTITCLNTHFTYVDETIKSIFIKLDPSIQTFLTVTKWAVYTKLFYIFKYDVFYGYLELRYLRDWVANSITLFHGMPFSLKEWLKQKLFRLGYLANIF